MTQNNGEAIDAEEFATLMDAVVPHAVPPRLAVATSGGPDSMALCLLAAQWIRRFGGTCDALIVDHRLRPESADEAALVADWLNVRGVNAHILVWQGNKPTRGIQAAAREARYGLLLTWCRDHEIGNLLLGHHRDDQAETFLMRLGRKSGVDGLAAMSPVSERDGVRLVRPLLEVPKARLRGTLECLGQPWIDDPSNVDPAYTRSSIRALGTSLEKAGISAESIATVARRVGRAREALEHYAAQLIRENVTVDPAGFCWLERDSLLNAPEETGLRALSRVLSFVGARPRPPRLERLERLYADLRSGTEGPKRTLAGCRILDAGERILVCRESRGEGERVSIAPGCWRRWDGRFDVFVQGGPVSKLEGTHEICRLGTDGLRFVLQQEGMPERLRSFGLPSAVRPTLPALWDNDGPLHVPHLDYCRDRGGIRLLAEFVPSQPLLSPPFSVVSADSPPI